LGHWADGLLSPVGGHLQQVAMSPSVGLSVRKNFTEVDWAGLDDIGWDVVPSAPIVGDLNDDSLVSLVDINAFVLAIVDPAAYAAAYPDVDLTAIDPDGSGYINLQDINPFVVLITGGGSAAVAPEPAMGAWLLLAGLLLSHRHTGRAARHRPGSHVPKDRTPAEA